MWRTQACRLQCNWDKLDMYYIIYILCPCFGWEYRAVPNPDCFVPCTVVRSLGGHERCANHTLQCTLGASNLREYSVLFVESCYCVCLLLGIHGAGALAKAVFTLVTRSRLFDIGVKI